MLLSLNGSNSILDKLCTIVTFLNHNIKQIFIINFKFGIKVGFRFSNLNVQIKLNTSIIVYHQMPCNTDVHFKLTAIFILMSFSLCNKHYWRHRQTKNYRRLNYVLY